MKKTCIACQGPGERNGEKGESHVGLDGQGRSPGKGQWLNLTLRDGRAFD